MQRDKKMLLMILAAIAAIELIACERQLIPTPKSVSEALLRQGAPGGNPNCRCGSMS